MALKFIQKAIKHPGALHADLGVPQGQKIPEGKISAAIAAGKKPDATAAQKKTAKRAQFARTLSGMK